MSISVVNDELPAGAPQVFTINETARVMRVSPARVYEMAAQGVFQTVKIGRKILVPKAEIERVLTPAKDESAA